MLTENQINDILSSKMVVFTTASKTGKPRSIFVVPSRVSSDQIIMSNIQMHTSIKNIKENNQCFVNAYLPEKDDLQIKVEGIANVFSGGGLFDEIKNYEESENLPPELKVHSIIVIKIVNVEESNG